MAPFAWYKRGMYIQIIRRIQKSYLFLRCQFLGEAEVNDLEGGAVLSRANHVLRLDRQIQKQIDRQIYRQIEREVLSIAVPITFSGQIDRYMYMYIDRQGGRCCPQPCLSRSQTRQIDRKIYRQIDTQIDREAGDVLSRAYHVLRLDIYRQIYRQIEREVLSLAVHITFSGQIQIDRQIYREGGDVLSCADHVLRLDIDRQIDIQRGRSCPQLCRSRSQARYRQIYRQIEREVMSFVVQITFSGQRERSLEVQMDIL